MGSPLRSSISVPSLPMVPYPNLGASTKLPSISPLLQKAGINTFQANPFNANGAPMMPPPVPLVPPSLFGSHPSWSEVRDPMNGHLYLDRFRRQLPGDYISRGGLGILPHLYGDDKGKL